MTSETDYRPFNTIYLSKSQLDRDGWHLGRHKWHLDRDGGHLDRDERHLAREKAD